MGQLEGKVAFVTGAARGQGRSHAVRLAQEGADIIAVDLVEQVDSVTPYYELSSPEDLAETVRQVEALDRRIVAARADVRDYNALSTVVEDAVAQLGRLDIVVANAGIFTFGTETHKVSEQSWRDLMDINITGVWHSYKAAAEHLIAAGKGGSVILISSLAGFKGLANVAAYTTTKHALVGLMKVLANELGPHEIRVNTIHPNAIDTPMVKNETTYKLFRPDLEHPTLEDAEPAFGGLNPYGVVGLMKTLALEYAKHGIRVNSVHPGAILTPMTSWQGVYDMFAGKGPGEGTEADMLEAGYSFHALKGNGFLSPQRIADAALFLNSDLASSVTGIEVPVDAGHLLQPGYNPNPVKD